MHNEMCENGSVRRVDMLFDLTDDSLVSGTAIAPAPRPNDTKPVVTVPNPVTVPQPALATEATTTPAAADATGLPSWLPGAGLAMAVLAAIVAVAARRIVRSRRARRVATSMAATLAIGLLSLTLANSGIGQGAGRLDTGPGRPDRRRRGHDDRGRLDDDRRDTRRRRPVSGRRALAAGDREGRPIDDRPGHPGRGRALRRHRRRPGIRHRRPARDGPIGWAGPDGLRPLRIGAGTSSSASGAATCSGVNPIRSATACSWSRSAPYTSAAFCANSTRRSSSGTSDTVARRTSRVFGTVPSWCGKSAPHMIRSLPICSMPATSMWVTVVPNQQFRLT